MIKSGPLTIEKEKTLVELAPQAERTKEKAEHIPATSYSRNFATLFTEKNLLTQKIWQEEHDELFLEAMLERTSSAINKVLGFNSSGLP